MPKTKMEALYEGYQNNLQALRNGQTPLTPPLQYTRKKPEEFTPFDDLCAMIELLGKKFGSNAFPPFGDPSFHKNYYQLRTDADVFVDQKIFTQIFGTFLANLQNGFEMLFPQEEDFQMLPEQEKDVLWKVQSYVMREEPILEQENDPQQQDLNVTRQYDEIELNANNRTIILDEQPEQRLEPPEEPPRTSVEERLNSDPEARQKAADALERLLREAGVDPGVHIVKEQAMDMSGGRLSLDGDGALRSDKTVEVTTVKPVELKGRDKAYNAMLTGAVRLLSELRDGAVTRDRLRELRHASFDYMEGKKSVRFTREGRVSFDRALSLYGAFSEPETLQAHVADINASRKARYHIRAEDFGSDRLLGKKTVAERQEELRAVSAASMKALSGSPSQMEQAFHRLRQRDAALESMVLASLPQTAGQPGAAVEPERVKRYVDALRDNGELMELLQSGAMKKDARAQQRYVSDYLRVNGDALLEPGVTPKMPNVTVKGVELTPRQFIAGVKPETVAKQKAASPQKKEQILS